MGHTWSLAVEFQFYVAWALTLAALGRARRPNFKLLIGLAVTVAVISAVWRSAGWLGDSNLNRPYAGTDTRLDALFLGATAALCRLRWFADGAHVPRQPSNAWIIRGLECGMVAVVGGLIGKELVRNSALYFSGFAIVGAATSGVILTALLSPASLLGLPLQNKILVWFGQLSYSLYLWHVPVSKLVKPEKFTHLGFTPWVAEGIRALLCVLVAAASYYGIERWFLRLKDRKRRAGG